MMSVLFLGFTLYCVVSGAMHNNPDDFASGFIAVLFSGGCYSGYALINKRIRAKAKRLTDE